MVYNYKGDDELNYSSIINIKENAKIKQVAIKGKNQKGLLSL